jgi:signal transduction histidine kinase
MSSLSHAAHHAPFPVELGELPAERLPEYIDVAAYFVVADALAGARSADARHARVGMAVDAERLTVEISDDGCDDAVGARRAWLRRLSDRLAAIEGRLDIESTPGRGTTVRACIPCT